MKKINSVLAESLTHQALETGRLRKNYNFHESYNENIQRMLNALEPGTYLPPHRHSNPHKDEYFLVLMGEILLIEFTEEGTIRDYFLMNPLKGNFGGEVKAGIWHTLISLAPGSVIYEFKEGPFIPISPENIAPWAPDAADSVAVSNYIQKLIEEVNSLERGR